MQLRRHLALALLVSCVLFACAVAVSATDLNLTPRSNKGTDHIQGVPYDGGRLPGDTIEDPFIIVGSFFSGSGNTCGFANNYEEMCPYSSNSPDVVYKYTPDVALDLCVDLCASGYDTKVFVYDFEAGYGFGTPLACNDDAGCGYSGYQSRLEFFTQAGRTYYIVVDGYAGDCGDYALELYEVVVGNVECPDGALLEGEPDCYDEYVDHHNGGCGSHPEVFSWLPGTEQGEPFAVCGTGGTFTFEGSAFRDTDWYQLDVSEENEITFECRGEFPLLIIMIDSTGGCGALQILDFASADPYETASLTRTFAPGIYWFWVGASVFDGVPCGSRYVMTLSGYTMAVSPAEVTTWGSLKSAFK